METDENKLYLKKRIIEFLEQNPGEIFNTRQIAEWVFSNYEDACRQKIERSDKIKDEKGLITQLVSEIGRQSPNINHPQIKVTKTNKGREFYYNETGDVSDTILEPLNKSADKSAKHSNQTNKTDNTDPDEFDLYPILGEYLRSRYPIVYAKHINDKESKKNEGTNAHQWRHPDLVGAERAGEHWGDDIRKCVDAYSGEKSKLRLWSFEVKKEITKSASRQYFFQTVSNSSWANLGYLVAKKIHESAMKDLFILSSLHGIGLIRLDVDNPEKSQIIIPAKERKEIDWSTADTLVKINPDFKDYIKNIRLFYQMDEWDDNYWNRLKEPR